MSSLKRDCICFHQVSNEITQDEDTEKATQPPLEREVFAEVVWQWGTRYAKLRMKGGVSPGKQISGCQQGLDADVLPDASYALPPPMAQTQENLREDSSAILLFRSKS